MKTRSIEKAFRFIFIFAFLVGTMGFPVKEVQAQPILPFSEDFSDGEITSNPAWEPLNNAWAVINGELHSDGLIQDQSDRYRMNISSYPAFVANDYVEFSYRGMLKSVGNPQAGRGITLVIGNSPIGYDLNIQNGVTSGYNTDQSSISFGYRRDNNLYDLIVSDFVPEYDRVYQVKAVRQAGVWTLFVDGLPIGSAADPLAITEFNFVLAWMTGSVMVDDIRVAYEPNSGPYDEARVRYILADAQLGDVIGYYRQFLNDPSVAEAVWRWDAGVRVANINLFERKIVGTWQVVYLGTETTINGMDVTLAPALHAWIEAIDPASGTVRINGVDPLRPGIPFTFDWGDGVIEQHWFGASHTYTDPSWEYTVTITAHYPDGSTASTQVVIPWYVGVIHAYPESKFIDVQGGAVGRSITLSINDGVGHSMVLTGWPQGNNRYVSFQLNGWSLRAGDVITAFNGIATRTLVVTPPGTITLDPDTDTASGTMRPYSMVDVYVSPSGIRRVVDADGDGKWNVDFSVPGADPNDPSQQIVDLVPGSSGTLFEWDADGDRTGYGWNIPIPFFGAFPYADRFELLNWPVGTTMTLKVWNPGTDRNGTPDFSTTFDIQPGEVTTGNPPVPTLLSNNDTILGVMLRGRFDIQPGSFATLTDGVTTREITVYDLAITNIDASADRFYGTGEPGVPVNVGWFCNNTGCAHRREIPDAQGYWVADYSQPGDEPGEQTTFDLLPGMSGESNQWDPDGDFVEVFWTIPDPHFIVRMVENEVHGFEWPLGTQVTLTIDDPSNDEGVDFSSAQTVNNDDGVFGRTEVRFILGNGFKLAPGQHIHMAGGGIVKEHTVTSLAVTGVDAGADTVSGTAKPGENVIVGRVCDANGCALRHVIANANGEWMANFSVFGQQDDEQTLVDLQPGIGSEAIMYDADNDATAVGWFIRNEHFIARVPENEVHGFDWLVGAEITLTIDDPSTDTDVPYTDTQTVVQDPWNPAQTIVQFILGNAYQLAPGLIVSLTGEGTTKTHEVRNLTVTGVDADADTVSGTAKPGENVIVGWVCDGNGCAIRYVIANANGEWMADFSVVGQQGDEQTLFDLQPGISSEAIIYDADNDATSYGWSVPSRPYPCQPGTTISGHVLTAIGSPAIGGWVAFDGFDTGNALFITEVDGNGYYSCYLPAGDYRLRAGSGSYSDEFYPDTIFENASRVGVTSATHLENISFSLDLPKSAYDQLTFNFNDPVIADLAVRQAIAYGTDRARIQAEAYPNAVLLNSYIPALHWAYASTGLPQYLYDPDQARSILQAAGWVDSDGDGVREKNGQQLHFVYIHREVPYRNIIATIFAQNMAAIGVEVEVLSLPSYQFGGYLFGHNFGIAEFGWATGVGGIEQGRGAFMGWTYYSSDEWGVNVGSYNNPAADQLLLDSEPFTTRAELLPYYQQHQVMVMNDLVMLPLFLINNNDMDGDGIGDWTDNARSTYNPDQRDSDHDGVADILDPCPADSTNTCNTAGSTAIVVGAQGGTLTTENQKASLQVPAGSVGESISFSITDMGAGYQLGVPGANDYKVVGSYSIQPHGTQFSVPATLTLSWEDADNNGIVDGTSLPEEELYLFKDGALFVGQPCKWNPNCDMQANTLVVTLNGLSLFELAGPENRPPVLLTITGPVDPRQVGAPVTLNATFIDPDPADTHIATLDWGDGTTSQGAVDEVLKTVTATHRYSYAGVYTVKVSISDFAGRSGDLSYRYLVIYDPSAGFITGGGWSETQPGFYQQNPSLTGKANFGFEIRYKKGVSLPSGNLEFQFKPASLNFKATGFDWLIINGSTSLSRGTGTINGKGNYGFLLSMVDGSPDRIRIKIWDKLTGAVIYDSMAGAAEDSIPATAIGGGSIVIHK